MLETGAILVPTRSVMESFLADLAGAPAYAVAKGRALVDVHAAAVALAIGRGVTIAAGTDIALTGADLPDSWGTNGAEFVHLVKLGMTPLQAIEAGTATGPLTLGPQAPVSGRLEAGYDADVITLDSDPLADISVLARPEQITGVWKAGRKVK
jgi:imidazolonepropionase-like amidohydrolase